MQEIKIPDGHKATLLGGTIRIEPIEKVREPEFKRGDIVYHDAVAYKWVFIYTHKEGDSYEGLSSVCLDSEQFYVNKYNNYQNKEIRLATPEEQQILFDALAKEGKYWDAEALEVKDIPKEEIIKNIFRELRGHNLSVNEAYRRMHKLIPINN